MLNVFLVILVNIIHSSGCHDPSLLLSDLHLHCVHGGPFGSALPTGEPPLKGLARIAAPIRGSSTKRRRDRLRLRKRLNQWLHKRRKFWHSRPWRQLSHFKTERRLSHNRKLLNRNRNNDPSQSQWLPFRRLFSPLPSKLGRNPFPPIQKWPRTQLRRSWQERCPNLKPTPPHHNPKDARSGPFRRGARHGRDVHNPRIARRDRLGWLAEIRAGNSRSCRPNRLHPPRRRRSCC